MSVNETKEQLITLEDLARRKLQTKIVQQIDEAEIEFWEKFEPGFRLKITKKYLECRIKVSSKKLTTFIGGLIGSIWIVFRVIEWLIPIVESYFS